MEDSQADKREASFNTGGATYTFLGGLIWVDKGTNITHIFVSERHSYQLNAVSGFPAAQ